jgi:hypothetical protein
MTEQSQTEAHPPEKLRYQVPDRQDPVVVLAALAGADYRIEPETAGGHLYITIDCPHGREDDREQIRDVIAEAADQTSLEGPRFERRVTFDDET